MTDEGISEGYEEEIRSIQRENEQLKQRINELTALLFRLTDQFETDFFTYSTAFMNNQHLARTIKGKLLMTPEIWEIVNRSRQQEPSTDSVG